MPVDVQSAEDQMSRNQETQINPTTQVPETDGPVGDDEKKLGKGDISQSMNQLQLKDGQGPSFSGNAIGQFKRFDRMGNPIIKQKEWTQMTQEMKNQINGVAGANSQ